MSEKILIIGASGRVGSELAGLLIARGGDVRAAGRNPSAVAAKLPGITEAVAFDFERPGTFVPALEGVAKVFLIARPGDNHSDEAAMPFIDAAVKAGIRRIVDLTAMGTEQDETFMLRRLEKYVEASGIPFVHLRPNWFMQNFSSGPMLADIRATGALHLPASDAKLSFIDTRDIAAVAFAALEEARHEARAYTLTGGEAMDHYEVVDILSRASGRAVAYVPLSEEAANAGLRKAGVPAALIERWTEFYRKVRQGFCAPVTHDTQAVLGRPEIRFEQFARDHAAAWKQACR